MISSEPIPTQVHRFRGQEKQSIVVHAMKISAGTIVSFLLNFKSSHRYSRSFGVATGHRKTQRRNLVGLNSIHSGSFLV